MSVLSRWKDRLHARKGLLARARASGDQALIKKRIEQVKDAENVIKRHTPKPKMTATVAFDGTPVFRGLARMLLDARKHGWDGHLNSADRRKGVAEKYGKKSQFALYMGFIKGLAGFNPANPPGRSTHELRSDSTAYAGPVGRPLQWWQLGLDVGNAEQLIKILNRLGYSAFRPYSSGSEQHHVNLKRSPYKTLKKRKLLD